MKLTHTRLRLYADLPRADALRLAARMRRFPAVAAASVRQVRIYLWHEGAIPSARICAAAERAVREAAEKAVTPTEQMAEFRRDAVISLAGFAAMELLRRGAPEVFAVVKILRSLLVLGIARNFKKHFFFDGKALKQLRSVFCNDVFKRGKLFFAVFGRQHDKPVNSRWNLDKRNTRNVVAAFKRVVIRLNAGDGLEQKRRVQGKV